MVTVSNTGAAVETPSSEATQERAMTPEAVLDVKRAMDERAMVGGVVSVSAI